MFDDCRSSNVFLAVLAASAMTTFSAAETATYLQKSSVLIQQVAAYDNGDHRDRRQTYENFSASESISLKELENTLSPSGRLRCGPENAKAPVIGSAQVTLRSDVITTAAHMFWSDKNCHLHDDPKTCVFVYQNGDVTRSIKIRELVGTGYKCAQSKKEPKRETDWAVLKLEGGVVGPKPYTVDLNKVESLKEYDRVVSVGTLNVDFYAYDKTGNYAKGVDGKPIRPPMVQRCAIQETYGTGFTTSELSTDCGIGSGGSGGALLDWDLSNPKLLAINVADLDKRKYPNTVDGPFTGTTVRPFLRSKWETFSVPLSGEFYEALVRAAK